MMDTDRLIIISYLQTFARKFAIFLTMFLWMAQSTCWVYCIYTWNFHISAHFCFPQLSTRAEFVFVDFDVCLPSLAVFFLVPLHLPISVLFFHDLFLPSIIDFCTYSSSLFSANMVACAHNKLSYNASLFAYLTKCEQKNVFFLQCK